MPRSRVIEVALVVLLAVAGLADAMRLAGIVRAKPMSDVVGPDRYLLGVALALLVSGTWYLASSRKAARKSSPADSRGAHRLGQGARINLLLAAYVLAIPTAGYALSTACFFPLGFYISGERSLMKSIVLGLMVGAFFVALFQYFAGIPVPRGWLDNLLP